MDRLHAELVDNAYSFLGIKILIHVKIAQNSLQMESLSFVVVCLTVITAVLLKHLRIFIVITLRVKQNKLVQNYFNINFIYLLFLGLLSVYYYWSFQSGKFHFSQPKKYCELKNIF